MIQQFPNGAIIVLVNDEWVPVFAGGQGGMSYNQSKSRASQETGLRGTPYAGNAAQQANDQGMVGSNLVNQVSQSPVGMLNYGRQALPSGHYGLGENVDQGVEALGNYQFGQASKDSATRGQTSPENMSGVIGSSIQNMLPFLIPQLQQHQYQQFTAPQSMLNLATQSADYWNRALGSQGKSASDAFGFSAQGGVVPSGCWIAEAIYGPEAIQTHLARFYVNHELWTPLRRLYILVGQSVARVVRRSPLLKALLKPAFDWMVSRMTQETR